MFGVKILKASGNVKLFLTLIFFLASSILLSQTAVPRPTKYAKYTKKAFRVFRVFRGQSCKSAFIGIDKMLKKFATIALTGSVLFIAMLGTSVSSAQSQHDARMVFLHFRLKNDTITLVKSAIRPGVVKQRRQAEKRGGIYFEAVSSAGLSLWNGVMDDPTIQRLEYEDPSQPGQIKINQVQLKETEFVIRLPFKPELHRVEFYRLELPAGAPGKQNFQRRLIGSTPLQLPGGQSQ
jgi:hypothetical protein